MTLIAYHWQLEGWSARIAGLTSAATIDLARPGNGLQLQLKGLEKSPPAGRVQILGFTFGETEPLDGSRLDAYVRGADLVATYDETLKNRVRAQAYWRQIDGSVFCPSDPARIVMAFEMIVSVNTSLLDSDPQATVVSSLDPIAEFQALGDSSEQVRSRAAAAPIDGKTAQTTGSFLARLANEQFSYVELLHPADHGSSSLKTDDGSPGRVVISRHLFQQRLEKGVILRARLRGGVIERIEDEAVAVAAYREFAASEPPLTV